MPLRIFAETRASVKGDLERYLQSPDAIDGSLRDSQCEITDLSGDQQLRRTIYGEAIRNYEATIHCHVPLATMKNSIS